MWRWRTANLETSRVRVDNAPGWVLPFFRAASFAWAAAFASGASGSAESDIAEGDSLLQARKYAEASASYENALRQNASLPAAHRGIALAAWRSGDLATALDRYARAVELEPNSALYHAEYGGVLSDSTLHPRAIEQLKTATTVSPDNAEFWRRYGDVLWRGEVYPDAVAAYERAIELDPSDTNAYVGLGDTYLRIARLDEAIAAYDRAIERNPKARAAFVGKGSALVKKGFADDGIKALTTALALDSQYAPVYYELGIALMQNKDYETAIRAFAGAAKWNPRDPGPYANMSRCYARLGDKERSRLAKERADQLQKIHDDLLVAEAYVHANPGKAEAYAYLGSIYEQAGDTTGAERMYLHAVKRDPSYPQANKALGDLYLLLRRLADAETHLQRAIALRPSDVETRVTLGLLYMETERFELGRDSLRAGKEVALALTTREPSAANWNLLAFAQFALNEYADAERSMSNALELDPNNADYRQRMDTIRAARTAP